MTPDDFVDRQDLIDKVLFNIEIDVNNGDFTAIEELIKRLPDSSDALIYVVCKVRAERVAELRAAARTEAP